MITLQVDGREMTFSEKELVAIETQIKAKMLEMTDR